LAKKFYKGISVILAALSLSAVMLTACSTAAEDEKANEMDTTEAETTAKYLDGLPEKMDFEGETIRVLSDTHSVYKLTERSLVSEELTGDIVDDAVYKRNQIIFDRFNCGIEIVKKEDYNKVKNSARQSVLSNSDDYDLFALYMCTNMELAAEGILLNLNDLPNLDFTQPYWSQSMIEGLSYKDATYWCTGDLALRYIGGMYVTFVNKNIWDDFFSDIDCYQLALDGEWTLDTLYDMSSIVYDDLDLDGQRDLDDIYGFGMNLEDPFEATMTGCLAFMSSIDDEGVPQIDIDYDRISGYVDKIVELVYNNPGGTNWQGDDNVTVMRDFADGHMMCVINKLFMSEQFLREMEDDFAVLPSPKYDVDQEQYNTTLHDGLTLFGIPVTNTKIEMTTMILEALAAESYRTVTPVYYEMALKVKYVRDDMSAMMIDLVREGVVNDFAIDCGDATGSLCMKLREIIWAGGESTVSTLKSYEPMLNEKMSEFLEDLEKYSAQ